MIATVNKFTANVKSNCAYVEPDFDYSVDFSCELKDDRFIVSVQNASAEKIAELKDRYEWLGEEQVETPY